MTMYRVSNAGPARMQKGTDARTRSRQWASLGTVASGTVQVERGKADSRSKGMFFLGGGLPAGWPGGLLLGKQYGVRGATLLYLLLWRAQCELPGARNLVIKGAELSTRHLFLGGGEGRARWGGATQVGSTVGKRAAKEAKLGGVLAALPTEARLGGRGGMASGLISRASRA